MSANFVRSKMQFPFFGQIHDFIRHILENVSNTMENVSIAYGECINTKMQNLAESANHLYAFKNNLSPDLRKSLMQLQTLVKKSQYNYKQI